MRVSYIRKIKDQIPLSQADLNIIRFTLMNAIKHHNAGVIEPLLTRGVPLLLVLYNNQTALYTAVEANCPQIVEMLLIESMRTFQLFPVDDIIKCFRWIFIERHYHLVDLMLFAVKQHPKSQKAFEKTMKVIDAMDKLVDLYKKNETQPYHLKEFEIVLNETPFDKTIFFYLHNKWKKDLSDKFQDSVELYRLLADFYFKKDTERRKQSVRHQYQLILGQSVGLIVLAGLGRFCYQVQQHWIDALIPIMLGVCLFGLFVKTIRELPQKIRFSQDAIRDRLLMKACRDGDYAKVSELITAGAHVNSLCGIGETTALFEATLFRNQTVINLLQQFNAYSGQGKETLTFP